MNIELFATPDNEEALQKYMTAFSNSKDLYAAELGYAHYKDILRLGQLYVHDLLNKSGLKPNHTLVLVTVAGMRHNLLDKDYDNEPTRDTEQPSSTD